MPVRKETNVRASRRGAEITTKCAIRHPGQTNTQAQGTKKASTLGPALGMRFYHFHRCVCGPAAWDD